MPTVTDEPALWASIPNRLKPNVEAAAIAMCRLTAARLADEGEKVFKDGRNHCDGCGTEEGGSCLAFGLYGHEAFAAAKAIDDLQMTRLGEALFG